jgi:hypothetical protein
MLGQESENPDLSASCPGVGQGLVRVKVRLGPKVRVLVAAAAVSLTSQVRWRSPDSLGGRVTMAVGGARVKLPSWMSSVWSSSEQRMVGRRAPKAHARTSRPKGMSMTIWPIRACAELLGPSQGRSATFQPAWSGR